MPLFIELDKVLNVFLYPALVLFVTSLIVTRLRVTSLVCDPVHLGILPPSPTSSSPLFQIN
jgi:hypothetical protein